VRRPITSLQLSKGELRAARPKLEKFQSNIDEVYKLRQSLQAMRKKLDLSNDHSVEQSDSRNF
jgi:hypothetical protein